jgi:multisubunit Na+/H+ antiporter MnhG subunit
MRPVIRRPFKTRSPEEVMALLSAVATAILAVIIIAMLYFGRDIFVPIALAILPSFMLAPVVGHLAAYPCAARVGGRERGHTCLAQYSQSAFCSARISARSF